MVRLKNLTAHRSLPDVLELPFPGTVEQATMELRHWGHELLLLDCWPQALFACFPIDEGNVREGHHQYLMCRHEQVPEEEDQIITHSAHSELPDIDLLRLLCQLGYDRAVILCRHSIRPGWTKVVFSHQPPSQPDRQQTKLPGVWPPPFLPLTGTTQPLFDFPIDRHPAGQCQLLNGVTAQDLRGFFGSGRDILCRDFHCIDLPDNLSEALCPYSSVEPMPDLPEYDRILIFTDGTSTPAMRRLPPEQADEIGLPDAWAYIVVGVRGEPDHPQFYPLGWTAQVVRYFGSSLNLFTYKQSYN